MIHPSFCNSINTHCKEFPVEQCKHCSHGEFYGNKKIDGIKYKWTFIHRFGFLDDNIDWENEKLNEYLSKWLKRIGAE